MVLAVESVVSQNFDGDVEVVIIDDGSTDDTFRCMLDLGKKYSNVIVLSNDKNRGVNYTRNRGITNAKGKYIIFLDSDETLTQNSLNIMCEAITSFPKYKGYIFLNNGPQECSYPSDNQVTYNDLISNRFTGDFTYAIKRSCFDTILFNQEYRAYELLTWLEIFKQYGPFLLIKSLVKNTNISDDRLSQHYQLNSVQKITEFQKFLGDLLINNGKSYRSYNPKYYSYLHRRFIYFSVAIKTYSPEELLPLIIRKKCIVYCLNIFGVSKVMLKYILYKNRKK